MPPVFIGRPLIRVAEVGSTMDLMASLADRGARSGTVVLAGYQSAGRGRAGRSWQAEPGESILMSFLHRSARPQARMGLLAPALGLAVAETVDDWQPGQAAIKWPNDVLVDGLKIAGLLSTSRAMPGEGTRIIAGIGLNVRNRPPTLPETATSLSILTGQPVSLEAVLEKLLTSLASVVERFERGDDSGLAQAVAARMAWRGQWVSVAEGDRVLAGTLDGLDPDGALRVLDASGMVLRIVAGDLTRGPRLSPAGTTSLG